MRATTPIQDPQQTIQPVRIRLVLFDPLLMLAVLGLITMSIVAIAGATSNDIAGQPNYYVYRQTAYAVAGILIMLGLSRIDYSHLRNHWGVIYGFLIGSILLVLAVGGVTRGARSWIALPFFEFQPSELGKVLLIVVLAAFMVERVRDLQRRQTTAKIILMALVPAGLVIIQPDMGTGSVYVMIVLAAMFWGGTPLRHFAFLAGICALAVTFMLVIAPMAGVELLKPYQVDRLTSFLHPSENTGEESYQQNQSLIAIGSGEKAGRGEEHATQTQLDFLPEDQTDFIFAVTGERFGFIGAALVLSLFSLLIWRALRIVMIAKNLFGALIAGGIVAMLLAQIFINIGMTVGIMPITGVPLPLFSYGGASVISAFIAVGLLQSIYVQGRTVAAAKPQTVSI
jgi:rod shape determining protein RodA